MSVTLWLFLWGRIFPALLRMRIGYPGGTLVTATFIISSSSAKPAESRILNGRSSQETVWVERTGWWAKDADEDGKTTVEVVVWAPGQGGGRTGGWIRLWFSSCFQWSNERQNRLAIWVFLSYENRSGTSCFLSSPSKHHLYPMFSTKSWVCWVSCFYTPSIPLPQPNSSHFIWWKKSNFPPSTWFHATSATPKAHEWSLLSHVLSTLDPLL